MSDVNPAFYIYDDVEDEDVVVVEDVMDLDEDEEEDDDDEYEDDEDDDDDEEDDDEAVSTAASVKNKTTPLSIDDNCCGIEELMSKDNNEIDGLCCPICMEPWTSEGVHQVCCLPCGHIYGLSCIQKWIRQRQSSRKCPQCKRSCSLKDVRLLYASRIVVVDEELQKKVQKLEAKCASLDTKHAECVKREDEGKKREAELYLQVQQLKERARYLEGMLEHSERTAGSVTASSDFPRSSCTGQFRKTGCSNSFELQKEFNIEGARVFDVDASGQVLLIARRLTGMGGLFGLTKISLVAPHDRLDMQLPSNTKAVRDLRFSPRDRLLLVASLGKKLSIISSQSNTTVLTYDLPAAAWSCSWDISCSNYAYSGLQNGMLLVFDMRQTREPVKSLAGITCNPIHSLYSVSPESPSPSGVRTILTASSIGTCEWNFGGVDERPFLIPGSDNEGVCVSLACSSSNSNIVASYRPKVNMLNKESASQAVPTPSTNAMGNSVVGSHVSYKRTSSQCFQKLGSTCANVNDIRLPKSAIVDIRNDDAPLFVSGDEARGEITLQLLPSLLTVQHLTPQKFPVRDVKFTHGSNSSILGCLCDDILKLYSLKLS
ncbi:hypothetical protein ACET3Z_009474 [Daucus carota]